MEPEKKIEATEATPTADSPEVSPDVETCEKKSLRGLDSNPELLKKTIAEVLIENGNPAPKDLTEISENLGCSQPTVRKWLRKLEASGFLETKKESVGRGRPKTMYHPTQSLFDSLATGSAPEVSSENVPTETVEAVAPETVESETPVEVSEITQEPEEEVSEKISDESSEGVQTEAPEETSEATTEEFSEKEAGTSEEKTQVSETQAEESPGESTAQESEDTFLDELFEKSSADETAESPEIQESPAEQDTEESASQSEDTFLDELEGKVSPEAESTETPTEAEQPQETSQYSETESKESAEPSESSESQEEDELLSELEQKLSPDEISTEEAAREESSMEAEAAAEEVETPAETTEAQAAPEATPEAQAPPPEPAPDDAEKSERFKSITTTVDEAVQELSEKYVKFEKARAPQEFYEYCTFEPPAGYQELERYWVSKPYVWVSILYSPDRNERMYYLVEPSLTPGEKTALEMLHEHLLDRLTYDERVRDRDRAIATKVNQLLQEYGVTLTGRSINKLVYYLKRNYLGYGRVDGIIRDPNIEDISCDGLNVPMFIYSRRYQSLRTNIIFTDNNELDLFVIRLVERSGKQITLGKPTVDASLPEGYRLQATLGTEVTTKGSSFSIRKYAEEPFTPVDLLSYGTFSSEMLGYLWIATENKKNLILVGGTASGKTSTLNAFSMFIWPDAKIISIEDTRELALYQENWIPSITRPAPGERSIDMYDLLRQALRQRPEVIIMGEVRGKEALTMFQAMSTGHTCYSTMHAGSVQEMVHRLEGEPINIPHHMLAALDIVCLQLLTYYRDQRVRRNQSIVELIGIDPGTGALRTNRVFERNPLTDIFERVGESQVLREIAKERGWSALELEQELRRRQQVLEYLYKNNIRRLHEVAAILRQYYFEPEKVMEQIVSGKLKM